MASTDRVLTRRELNRALLGRQLLLERHALPAAKALERLGGLQAQSTPSPYLSLWTRLQGFEREELTEALERRRLVKALLQRGTLHVATPRPLLGGRSAADVSLAPRPELRLRDPRAALGHLGLRRTRRLRRGRRVRTYLRAYGPATSHDIGQWAGVPRLKPIAASLGRLALRTFRDERGKVLYDLPRAPLPDPETPAPARLVPRFDNLVLSHADRARILGDVPPARIVTKNGLVHATILVDGFVAGTWQLERGRVVLEPFDKLPAAAKRELKDEAERLEAFTA